MEYVAQAASRQPAWQAVTPKQKMKLLDFFVNGTFLYNDKFVIMLNYKGGEKTIRFNDLNEGIKKEHPIDECSSLLRCGDPYGNWKQVHIFREVG